MYCFIKGQIGLNFLVLGVRLFVVAVIFVVIAVNGNCCGNRSLFRDYLKVLAVTASNTWGLCLLVLLLGYGLIDVPRSCWHSARLRQRLARTYFSLAKMSLERAEAEETLEDVLDVSRTDANMLLVSSGKPDHSVEIPTTTTTYVLRPFSRTTWVSRHQQGEPFWILVKQEMMEWQWY